MKMHLSLVRMFLVITLIAVCNFPLVHLQYQSGKFLGKYPIEKETQSPINIHSDSEQVHKEDLKTFSFHAILSDKVKVINDGKLVEVLLNEDNTESHVTGSVFGDKKYKFKKIKYLWTNDTNEIVGTTIDGEGYPLNNVVVLYNEEYETFEEALNHRDGLAEIIFYTRICPVPNDSFDKYGAKLEQIQDAGSTVKTTLGIAIKWFADTPANTTYFAYPGSYRDENDKEYFCSTVITLSLSSATCLSEEQYEDTFGSFKNSRNESLINTEPRYKMTMPVVHAKGISIKTSL